MMGTHVNRRGWRRAIGSAAMTVMIAGTAACSGDDDTEALESELAEVIAERDSHRDRGGPR